MTKRDGIAWGVSLILHALLLIGFVFLDSTPEPMPVGFVEVEFGPISTGRPVERPTQPVVEEVEPEQEPVEAPEPVTEIVEEEELEPEPIEAPEPIEVSVEEEGKQVDLPDQELEIPEEDVVETPDTDVIGVEDPQTAETEPAVPIEEAQIDEQTQQGGDPDGTAGEVTGDDGVGSEEEQAAPYQLEGLEDRTVLREVLPRYTEQVNAVIQMRITVDPRGQIVSIIPLRKGNPGLERAVMDAMRRWRFNPLQPNLPQERQTGIVTFRFRLE